MAITKMAIPPAIKIPKRVLNRGVCFSIFYVFCLKKDWITSSVEFSKSSMLPSM